MIMILKTERKNKVNYFTKKLDMQLKIKLLWCCCFRKSLWVFHFFISPFFIFDVGFILYFLYLIFDFSCFIHFLSLFLSVSATDSRGCLPSGIFYHTLLICFSRFPWDQQFCLKSTGIHTEIRKESWPNC